MLVTFTELIICGVGAGAGAGFVVMLIFFVLTTTRGGFGRFILSIVLTRIIGVGAFVVVAGVTIGAVGAATTAGGGAIGGATVGACAFDAAGLTFVLVLVFVAALLLASTLFAWPFGEAVLSFC